jgi:hypothetical protein
MRKVHDRVSGGDLHNGTESENNSLSVEEFKGMISDLESIIRENNSQPSSSPAKTKPPS